MCFVYDDDVSDVVTPICLLYWRNLHRENKIVQEIDIGVIEDSDLCEWKCGLQNVAEHFGRYGVKNI